MINEIKEMLARGEVVELECVDSIRFSGAHHRNQSILKVGRLVVSDVDDTGVHLKDCFPGIIPEELKYFRIKRPAPTFNDLIDVAVQAYKDGVLSKVELRDDEINLTKLGVISSNRGSSVFQDAISDIKSLYTESFIVDNIDDIDKIRWKHAKANLPNGEVVELHFFDGSITRDVSLCLLKGATVTQKRGK